MHVRLRNTAKQAQSLLTQVLDKNTHSFNLSAKRRLARVDDHIGRCAGATDSEPHLRVERRIDCFFVRLRMAKAAGQQIGRYFRQLKRLPFLGTETPLQPIPHYHAMLLTYARVNDVEKLRGSAKSGKRKKNTKRGALAK